MAPRALQSKSARVQIKKNTCLERKAIQKNSAFLELTFTHVLLCAYVILCMANPVFSSPSQLVMSLCSDISIRQSRILVRWAREW